MHMDIALTYTNLAKLAVSASPALAVQHQVGNVIIEGC